MKMNRRDFLTQTTSAGAMSIGVGALGLGATGFPSLAHALSPNERLNIAAI